MVSQEKLGWWKQLSTTFRSELGYLRSVMIIIPYNLKWLKDSSNIPKSRLPVPLQLLPFKNLVREFIPRRFSKSWDPWFRVLQDKMLRVIGNLKLNVNWNMWEGSKWPAWHPLQSKPGTRLPKCSLTKTEEIQVLNKNMKQWLFEQFQFW